MNLSNLPNQPRVVAIAPAKKLLKESIQYNVPLPFASNVAHFFNVDSFNAAGIDPLGAARQLDQTLKQNFGNNIASRIKVAAAGQKDIPDQAVIDRLVEKYNFTGARTPSDEEGMTLEERTIRSELRKTLRGLINNGIFANCAADGSKTTGDDVVFHLVRVQTKPESDGTYKDAPQDEDGKGIPLLLPNNLTLEAFEDLVSAAYEGELAELTDHEGRTAELDFSEPVEYTETGKPANWSAIAAESREEALRLMEKRQAVVEPTTAIKITIK